MMSYLQVALVLLLLLAPPSASAATQLSLALFDESFALSVSGETWLEGSSVPRLFGTTLKAQVRPRQLMSLHGSSLTRHSASFCHDHPSSLHTHAGQAHTFSCDTATTCAAC